MAGVTKKTNERDLNALNQQMRATPQWQQWYQRAMADRNISDDERKQLQQQLAASGTQFGGGMEIDSAGNINQNEGFGRQLKKWGPLVGGGALAAFGIPGVMPGLLSGGGAAAGGAMPASWGFETAGGLPGLGSAGMLGSGVAAGAGGGSGAGMLAGLFGPGSILDKAGKLGGILSPVLGGAAGARAGAQQAQEAAQLSRDRLALDSYRTGLQAPRMRLGTSTAASLAANAQPLQLGAIRPGMGLRGERPTSTGGMNPGVLGPDTRQLAQTIMAQQLQEQLSGGGPPPIAGAPQSGVIDTLLGGGAFAGGILGALGQSGLFSKKPPSRGGAPTSQGVPVSRRPWNVRF